MGGLRTPRGQIVSCLILSELCQKSHSELHPGPKVDNLTDLEVFWRLRESENSGNNKPVNSVTGGQGRMMTSLFFVAGQKSDSCVSDQLKKPQSSVYGVEATALINSRGNENVNHILQIIKWKDVFGYRSSGVWMTEYKDLCDFIWTFIF